MNTGLLGFPAPIEPDTLTKRWWQYVQAATAVTGRPSRAFDTWYYNSTGEELIVNLGVVGSSQGLNYWVASRPVDPSLLTEGTAMPVALLDVVACLGFVWGTADYDAYPLTVPKDHWYYMQNGGASLRQWAEYRRSP